jgi:hypothetical protein
MPGCPKGTPYKTMFAVFGRSFLRAQSSMAIDSKLRLLAKIVDKTLSVKRFED